MQLVEIATPQLSGTDWEPADAVRTFVFMANLAAQEACGDAAASTSPQRVVQRLQGSTESHTYLFAVIDDDDAPLAEVGELGLPTIPAIEPSPEMDYLGFIHLSLPLLEERENADIECVLDAQFLPLPGQALDDDGYEVANWMARAALEQAQKLGRSIAQVGLLHPPEADPSYDAMSRVYTELGFQRKHSETQLQMDIPDSPAAPLLPQPLRAEIWPDYSIPDEYLDQVLELLTNASTDAHYGKLHVEPIQWTRQRLAEAHARLRQRRSHTLLVALCEHSGTNSDSNDNSADIGNSESKDAPRIVALTELSRHEAADPEVCEWTLTVTARGRRRAGLGMLAKLTALHEVNGYWPDVRRIYCSVADDDPGMNALYERLGARAISRSSAWELAL